VNKPCIFGRNLDRAALNGPDKQRYGVVAMLPVVVIKLVGDKQVVEHARVTRVEYDELVRQIGNGVVVQVIRLAD
jgi:hypothetical protein